MALSIVPSIAKSYPQWNHDRIISKSQQLINSLTNITNRSLNIADIYYCIDKNEHDRIVLKKYDAERRWNRIRLLSYKLSLCYSQSLTTNLVAEMISEFRWIILRFGSISSSRSGSMRCATTKEKVCVANQIKSLTDSYHKEISDNLPMNVLLRAANNTTPRHVQFLLVRSECGDVKKKASLADVAKVIGISVGQSTQLKTEIITRVRREHNTREYANNQLLKETEQLLSLALWNP